MIKMELTRLLNKQIELENNASIFYLNLASIFDNKGYEGLSNLYYEQSIEEREHMTMFVKYLNERGIRVDFEFSNITPLSYDIDMLGSLELSLNNEINVTNSILEIYNLSIEEKDYTTSNFIQWFIDEQRQEEDKFRKLIDKLNIGGNTKTTQFIIENGLPKPNKNNK